LARATIKYAIGKSVLKRLKNKAEFVVGQLFQGLLIYSVSQHLQLIYEHVILCLIQSSCQDFICLKAVHTLKVEFLDAKDKVVDSKDIELDIKVEKKNFIFIRSSSI
jgi:hypothetical protein